MTEQTPISSPFDIDGSTVQIKHINGRSYREGVLPQLGKRYVCGEQIDITKKAEDGTTTTDTRLLTGEIETNDGSVYVGCGAEMLTIKPSSEHYVLCCDIPMNILQPKVLPSAD